MPDVILCGMPHVCQVHQLGLLPYQDAWSRQEAWSDEIARGERLPSLLLLEHPHTFTFGRRGQASNLLWDEAELKRRSVMVFWVDRGGDVTYHGPGQLVGYPLLLLDRLEPGEESQGSHKSQALPIRPVDYIRMLEAALVQTLGVFGVQAGTRSGKTGVWVENHSGYAKIAAIGVKVDGRGLTRHGFALNVNPNMDYWQGIVSCGLPGERVTSLAELLDQPPGMPAVIDAIVSSFGLAFEYEMVASPVKTE